MTAQNRATTRDADQRTDQRTDRREQRPVHSSAHSPGEMALQSSRGFEATPQSFVRLTGSNLAKPRAIRADIIE
ncbi:hypothetical protein [Bradyrhizobium sp. 30]|uniref:hypothetical protein n=1 Tax=Bradyrhizobium sp. 30 TaxID=2782669 RepID=UPI001FF7C67B|nr:hypothetical protein [Bradyrhizobium sp. 30]MCK1293916.1 hypothetical protein [Bradyrhizobium sp. 30]